MAGTYEVEIVNWRKNKFLNNEMLGINIGTKRETPLQGAGASN